MKRLTILLAVLILTMASLLAWGSSESTKDFDLMYIPRHTANNMNIRIDLSQPVSISETNPPTTAAFSNDSAGHLSVFRISDSLQDSNANKKLLLTVSSTSNWYFVNENNSTVKRPFKVKALVWTSTRNNDGVYVTSETPTILEFTKVKNNYEATLPLSEVVTKDGKNNPKKVYDIDFCIYFENDVVDGEPVDYSLLEEGYYKADICVQTSKGYTTTSGSQPALNEPISVYGYIGADPGTNQGSYSFIVKDSTDTYSMDLGIKNHNTTPAYKVANVNFLYNSITTSQLSGDNNTTNKFKIYISPGPEYQTGGIYQLIKQGTESQARTHYNTVYYDLYLKTGANTYTAMSTSGDSVYEGTIGSWGSYNSTNTYVMKPKYTPRQIAEAGYTWIIFLGTATEGEDQYENSWELNQDIYVKLNSESLQNASNHQAGVYWSYIYFTLVTD